MSDDKMIGLFRAPLLIMVFLVSAASYAHGANSGDGASDAAQEKPTQTYSAAQIGAMLKRPKNVTELLQNLKIVVDHDLLLQPVLSDNDAVIMKLFAGSAVSRVPLPDTPGVEGAEGQDVSVTIDDPRFPKMTVLMRQGKLRDLGYGGVVVHEGRFGWIAMNVASVPNFTVAAVHGVFGEGSLDVIDYGNATDGATYDPTRKGSIDYKFYHDPTATSGPPYSRKYLNKELLFNIKFNVPTANVPAPAGHRRILSTDEVDSLQINVDEK